MALVTVAQLKRRLGITGTTCDADLADTIASAVGAVASYLSWDDDLFDDVADTTDVSAVPVTEFISPLGAELVTLRKAPPRVPVTLTAVWESTGLPPVFDADTLLTAGTDYAQEKEGGSAIVRLNRNWYYSARRMPNRLGAVFLPSTGTVKVTYTLNATRAKAVISSAALFQAMAEWQASYAGMGIGLVTSDSMDGASVSINTDVRGNSGRKANSADGFTSPLVAGMLDPFRLVSIA